jgi:hypothetical protein
MIINFLPKVSTAFILVTGAWMISTVAIGQELEPFESNQISNAQWQTYFYEVQNLHGDSAREVRLQHVVIFKDPDTMTTWTFTQLGHPAHPSWVARRVVVNGGETSLRQVGYFAGEDPPFVAFFQEQLELNKKLGQDF